MDRKPVERSDSGCRHRSTVTFNAKFTSAVFDGYALEARLLLAMARVMEQVDAGRARQYLGLARELAVLSGRLGHAEEALIANEPELAAAAAVGAILHRTVPFGRHGANSCFTFEVRRRRKAFMVVLAQRQVTESALELGPEISAVDQSEHPDLKSASAAAEALLQERLQRERQTDLAPREATVFAMYATYPWMGVVVAHEPPLEVVPSCCGQEATEGLQVPVATGGRRAA